MTKGTKVILVDSDKEKSTYVGGDFPSDFLKIGEVYTVEEIDIGPFHSYLYLKECPGKKFNSTHFREVKKEEEKLEQLKSKAEELRIPGKIELVQYLEKLESKINFLAKRLKLLESIYED